MPGASQPRFAFGENWQSFVATVTKESIAAAERGLCRLFPDGTLRGCRFLDIGCGSGITMLAAHRLGAASVHGIDLDPASIEAARRLLSAHLDGGAWSLRVESVFDLAPDRDGRFEIVYSWGVLHHTGDLWRALEKAAAMVAPEGQLAVALYRRTPMCRFWRLEKRYYAAASPAAQSVLRALYQAAYFAGLVAAGRSPARYVAGYSARGMAWRYDVHDWLGGYPYESTEPRTVGNALERLGFSLERVFERKARAKGLFGTHCDEYVARRRP
ncbi:MAG TPA: class I SAM-dependent methyltransferase [Stellaceae bacterium]|nr:class I SAM-dependent methyltransferase [Stellaceae bacterium]